MAQISGVETFVSTNATGHCALGSKITAWCEEMGVYPVTITSHVMADDSGNTTTLVIIVMYALRAQ
jgi:hypothetical protein